MRNLLPPFLLIAMVPSGLLVWFGGRLLEQDRGLVLQQAGVRREQTADLIVSGMRVFPSGEDAVAVSFLPGRVAVTAGTALPYYPLPGELPEAPSHLFSAAEEMEFRRAEYSMAIAALRNLARSPDPAVRGGALIRIARNLRKAGDAEGALAAYAEGTALSGVSVDGVPVSLLALWARCGLLAEKNRTDELHRQAQSLRSDLERGQWPIDRSRYEFHMQETSQWLGLNTAQRPAPETLLLAAGVEWLWNQWQNLPLKARDFSGRREIQMQGRTLLVSWQGDSRRLAGLVAGPGFDSANTKAELERLDARRRLWLGGLGLLSALVLAGSFFIARAVTRELAVARLQSDFVSAVSHEFRTPVTSLRQLTEILADGRITDEQRRGAYYAAMARQTERLSRLVESLLDFGRLEAGASPYRLEALDACALVRSVVDQFEKEGGGRGDHIELEINGTATIAADGEALGNALWNLLDNAFKYSPECHTVWVETAREGRRLSIRVRDQGLGIPADEQKEIFRKFVRGARAKAENIKGTGIGLAMVSHIVKAHGGEVRLESQPGAGSTFTIILPLKELCPAS